jgi:Domain of unknown function (DUF4384)
MMKRFTMMIPALVVLSVACDRGAPPVMPAPGSAQSGAQPATATVQSAAAAPVVEAAHPAAEPAKPQHNAARLSVRLFRRTEDGREVEVPRRSTFHSGDHVRLALRSSESGYLYLLTKGSSGRIQMLYPGAAGSSNAVRAKQEILIPSGSWIAFDERPGTETIYAVFSKQRGSVLFADVDAARRGDASAEDRAMSALGKGRDLVLASDDDEPTVSGGGELVGVLRLRHEL